MEFPNPNMNNAGPGNEFDEVVKRVKNALEVGCIVIWRGVIIFSFEKEVTKRGATMFVLNGERWVYATDFTRYQVRIICQQKEKGRGGWVER